MPALDRLIQAALVALAAFALVSHGADARIDASTAGAQAPWTNLAADDADGNFHFLVVGDRQGNVRPGVFASAMPKANLLAPAFVVSVGDLISGYAEDQAQLDRQWDEFEGIVAGLESPFFYVAGNHDMSNALMAETWRRRFGPSYYRFVYKGVLFLVLNSELFGMAATPDRPVPGPWTQAEQLAFVKQTLEEFPAPRWTFVFLHQPLWELAHRSRDDWQLVEEMLGNRDYTVFAGHRHRYAKAVRNDRKYFILATTGGNSALRGSVYGEFDHLVWVTMTTKGPRIANLMLDGIEDEDVTAHPPGLPNLNLMRASIAGRPLARQLPRPPETRPSPTGPVFEQAIVSFEVKSPRTTRAVLRYEVEPGPHMRYAGTQRELDLRQEVHRVDIPLIAKSPTALADLAPGRVKWTLAMRAPLYQVQLEFTSALFPASSFVLPSGAATVDGDLGEWPELPFEVLRQGDVLSEQIAPTDASFAFGMRESDGDLYLAARVTDDKVIASSAFTASTQDALMMFVDARAEPQLSANVPLLAATSQGHLARMALAQMTLVEPALDSEQAPFSSSFAAVNWRTARTVGGYVAEAKVSGQFLDAQAGEPWRAVRLSLTLVDWDDNEDDRWPWRRRHSRGVGLHWQPDRFGNAPAAGTGMFVRTKRP